MKTGQAFNPYRLFVGAFIPNALLRWSGVSPGAKLCYARLAQYAGKNGAAFPSQEELARELGVSERQVIRYLAELENKNLLRIHHPTGQDRLFHRHNNYEFLWHEIFENERADVTDSSIPEVTHTSPPIKENHIKENHIKTPLKSTNLNYIGEGKRKNSKYSRRTEARDGPTLDEFLEGMEV